MANRLTIKNYPHESQLFMRRIWTSVIIVAILVIALIARLAYLQIDQHKLYTTLSNQNQLSLIPIAPNRGLIYDRNGVLLAKNIPIFSLDITPDLISNLKTTINQLEKIVSITPEDVQNFYRGVKQHRSFEATPLKLNLTTAEVAKFYVNEYRFPGVRINARMMRYYPLGKAMSTVVGYVGRISASNLQHIDASNYAASNYIGKAGIEQFDEKALHGTVGYQQVEINASGRIVRVLKRIAPVPGDNLYLTIDSKLQVAAEKALGKHDGAVVAIQPNTGQVLAMVSNPSYNPNQFVQGISAKAYHALQSSPNKPMFNRTIRGQYPLGSTIKPILSLEALSSHTITPSYTIFDPGYFRLPHTHHTYHDWKIGGHGEVDLTKAITVSCDTFFYNLSVLMGIHRIDVIMREFGFGQHTGIGLDGELPGLVASPEWKWRTKGQHWYTGDTIISGIGQGFMLATPLQLAAATAALSEHGKRYRPNLLMAYKPPGGIKTDVPATAETPVELHDPQAWRVVIQAMQDVISKPNGNAYSFGHTSYTIAAKTGTAQVRPIKYRYVPQYKLPLRLRNDSLFIAFAPVNHPEIAIAVVVEHDPGSSVSVGRKVMNAYFNPSKTNAKPKKQLSQQSQPTA